MNKKIYFVYPKSSKVNRLDAYQQPYEGLLVSFETMPIDLLSLAAIAKKEGFDCIIKDYSECGNVINDLKSDMPSYLVANICINHLNEELEFIKNIKNNFPNIKIIVKGFPFKLYNQNAIYEHNYIDYVIYGEPEITFYELITGVDEKEILGLCYRDNFQTILNKKRPYIDNLDKLPTFDYSLLDLKHQKSALIEVSRGANYKLLSDIISLIEGSELRYFSVKRIVEQISILKNEYKINNFYLKAFLINQNREWLEDFCKSIIQKKLRIKWDANFSLNIVDENLLKLLKKSGCNRLYIFFETCQIDTLKAKNNIEAKNNIKKIIDLIKKYNIDIVANVKFGYPWDNDETIHFIYDLLITTNINLVNFTIATPYPGTQFLYHGLASNLIENQIDYSKAGIEALVKTRYMSIEEINIKRKNLYKNFYFNKTKIIKLLFSILFWKNIKFYTNLYYLILNFK